MCQTETLNALKEGDWMTIKQIAEKTDVGCGSINCNLKRLLKQKAVERKDSGMPNTGYFYKII